MYVCTMYKLVEDLYLKLYENNKLKVFFRFPLSNFFIQSRSTERENKLHTPEYR